MSAKSAIARNDCSISIGRLQLLFRLDLRLTSSDPKNNYRSLWNGTCTLLIVRSRPKPEN
jgi:hypothetical protein